MKQFHVLIVDDDPDDHLFARSAIDEFGLSINMVSVYDGIQGLKYLDLQNLFPCKRNFLI